MRLHRWVNDACAELRPHIPEAERDPEVGEGCTLTLGIPGAEVGGGWELGPPLTFLHPSAWRMDHTLGLDPGTFRKADQDVVEGRGAQA